MANTIFRVGSENFTTGETDESFIVARDTTEAAMYVAKEIRKDSLVERNPVGTWNVCSCDEVGTLEI